MKNERILVVDDDVELSDIIKDFLEAEEFNIKVANNGQDALKYFNSFDPHLLVLDISMPFTDGFEVCRIVRSKSNVPIIFLTSKTNDMDKVLGFGLGGDDYITKPFNPIELVARVRAHLRRYISYSKDIKDKKEL